MATSRGPVREALLQLVEAGLVEIVPHKGAFVIHPSREELLDMVQVRAVLEGFAARMLAGRQTTVVLGRVEQIVLAMKAAATAGDVSQLKKLDWNFHEAICKGSGSPLLYKMWRQMRDRIGLMVSSSDEMIYSDHDILVSTHASLLEALKQATPEQAEALFRQKILEAGYDWLKAEIPAQFLARLAAPGL